ncbi:hypothetical protein [Planobispora rosea]|nr:hypothetical protein [Planobispora rosea]
MLHDDLSYGLQEIAAMLGMTEAACRQAYRAGRRAVARQPR